MNVLENAFVLKPERKGAELIPFILGQAIAISIAVLVTSYVVKAIFTFFADDITIKTLWFLEFFGNYKVIGVLGLLITSHEFGHMLMARKYGIPILTIQFPPFGGLAVSGRSYKANEMVWVALAGPAAGLSSILFMLIAVVGEDTQWMLILSEHFEVNFNLMLLYITLMWAQINFINLLPVYPLDGGWLLAKYLTLWVKPKTAKRISYFVSLLTVGILYLVAPKKGILVVQLILIVMMVLADYFLGKVFLSFSQKYELVEPDPEELIISPKVAVHSFGATLLLLSTLFLVGYISFGLTGL